AADNRLALPPSQVRRLAWALASALGVPGVKGVKLEGEAGRWVDALAKDLKRPAGTTLVVAGAGQPADVHLLAHAMNDRLGNFGKTVVVTAPVLPRPPRMSDMDYLKNLARDIEKGEVDTLLVLGGNPAYSAPGDVPFADRLADKLKSDRDWLAVRLGQHF